MCNHQHTRLPIHCIIPPFIVEKIIIAGGNKKSLLESATRQRFNDELFRKKRALLTEMEPEQKRNLRMVSEKLLEAVATPVNQPMRKIYDAGNSDDEHSLPGKLVRSEGEAPVADQDVNNIYDNCGHTWNLYNTKFGRNSIDNNGLPMINTVHFGTDFGNAFWEGTQMVYGDGDEVFSSFTRDIDITGHELTHGVVQYEANLVYEAQSGAINESMADVFGMMVRQLALNETAQQSDWLIGRTCMKGNGYALRSMAAPGTAYKNHPIIGDDPQPAHMNNYANLPNTRQGDYGGVHINSGITNHAFYLAAFNLGGYAWEKAGKIWYQALCDKTMMNARSQFSDLRNATVTKAELIFGVGSMEAQTVTKAWQDVGL